MRILPYEHLKFITELEQAEVHKRLNEVIEPVKLPALFGFGEKPYHGRFFDNTFKISLIKPFYQSGLVIRGDLKNDYHGCTVLVGMRLPFLFILILIILVLSLLSFTVSEIFALISGMESNHTGPMSGYMGILIYGGITMVNYFYLLAIFKSRVKEVREHFSTLFETDEIEDSGIEWIRDKGFDWK